MFYFSESDIQELLPVTECIRLMRVAFEALAQGRAQNQPRRRLILESGSVLHSMAGAVGNYYALVANSVGAVQSATAAIEMVSIQRKLKTTNSQPTN